VHHLPKDQLPLQSQLWEPEKNLTGPSGWVCVQINDPQSLISASNSLFGCQMGSTFTQNKLDMSERHVKIYVAQMVKTINVSASTNIQQLYKML